MSIYATCGRFRRWRPLRSPDLLPPTDVGHEHPSADHIRPLGSDLGQGRFDLSQADGPAFTILSISL